MAAGSSPSEPLLDKRFRPLSEDMVTVQTEEFRLSADFFVCDIMREERGERGAAPAGRVELLE